MSIGICASPLQIALPARSGSMACVGDVITYICNITSLSHSWMIPSFSINTGLNRGTLAASVPPFSLMVTDDDGTNIISALTVTAFLGLNGVYIRCVDGNARPDEADARDIVATVLGEYIISIII